LRSQGGKITLKIDISPGVWQLWERSWALFGVKDDAELIRMLELQMREESEHVLEDAERQLPTDAPAAIVQRMHGILKQKRRKNHENI
jgi:hypothetical protein